MVSDVLSPEVEAANDRLAREHSIDDYYSRSPLPIRLIERGRLRIIERMVAEKPGMKIAEVGSGGGHVLSMFRHSKLTAIDVSDVYLETARQRLKGYEVELIKGELQKLELPAASFDCVICTEVLEHTEEPSAIIAEIARLVAPGGRAVITVPNDPLIDGMKAVARRTPLGWALGGRVNWGGDEFHLHRWKPAAFRRLLERSFTVTEYDAAPSRLLPIRACFCCAPRARD